VVQRRGTKSEKKETVSKVENRRREKLVKVGRG
jgi:hypothetical protein